MANNPLRYVDPTGHRPDESGCIIDGCSLKPGDEHRDYVLALRNGYIDSYPLQPIDPIKIIDDIEDVFDIFAPDLSGVPGPIEFVDNTPLLITIPGVREAVVVVTFVVMVKKQLGVDISDMLQETPVPMPTGLTPTYTPTPSPSFTATPPSTLTPNSTPTSPYITSTPTPVTPIFTYPPTLTVTPY